MSIVSIIAQTSFLTDGGFVQNLRSKSDTNEVIFTLIFDLDRRSDRYSQSGLSLREEIEKQQQINLEKQQEEINDEEDDEDKSKKFTSPYLRFISTPMGGMTKWKRR